MRRAFSSYALVFLLMGTAFAFCGSAHAEDLTSANYRILAPSASSGGVYSTSANFSLLGTLGDTAHGSASSASFGTRLGFLPFPSASSPVLSATANDGEASFSWTASQSFLGWAVAGYAIGQASVSGGPYTFTPVGNVTSHNASGLTNGQTYYFVVAPVDALGVRLGMSAEAAVTPVSSTTPSAPSTGGSGSSGGSGGSGGGGSIALPTSPASITLIGASYPGSTVTVLKDSQVIESMPVDNAGFSITVGDLSGGTYLFSLYAKDARGTQSSSITIPVTVTPGLNTTVSGIFPAPTISADKAVVKQGNPLRVFGQAISNSIVTISVHSKEELTFQALSDQYGVYSYSLSTAPLEIGDHTANSNASKEGKVSRSSRTVAFTVGTEDVAAHVPTGAVSGDLNSDARVNLVDFSIAIFWYKKPGPPSSLDLNGDGKVDLVDLSIMASHWTG